MRQISTRCDGTPKQPTSSRTPHMLFIVPTNPTNSIDPVPPLLITHATEIVGNKSQLPVKIHAQKKLSDFNNRTRLPFPYKIPAVTMGNS